MGALGTASSKKGRKGSGPGAKSDRKLYVVGTAGTWRAEIGTPVTALRPCLVRTKRDLMRIFPGSPRHSIWLAKEPSGVAALAGSCPRARGDRRLLVLSSVKRPMHALLSSWFSQIVAADGMKFLGTAELVEALLDPAREDLFIGGAYLPEHRVVVLLRGSLETIAVPVEWFRGQGESPRADPARFSVIDGGQTVKLGGFEAAADAILYEFDADYRARARQRATETDTSLGGAIRRLRLQRGLDQRDFAPVPARTVGRLERGEVRRPRAATLARVAERLGVSVEALPSY